MNNLNNKIVVTQNIVFDLIGKYNCINIPPTFCENIVKTLPESVTLGELYDHIASTAVSKTSYHPDYGTIASRLTVEKLHLTTPSDIFEVADILYNNNDVNGKLSPIVSEKYYGIVSKYRDVLNSRLVMDRDFLFDYFGIKTLCRAYLMKRNGVTVERPQHMIMRVALSIHENDIESTLETYDLISQHYFIHATPTLFNAGTNRQQLSSCFLLGVDDNVESIYKLWAEAGVISKWAGGIGIHISSIRARGSRIRGTNGISDGIVPLCIVLGKIARYMNQGSKRNGSIACYLEPWHGDIYEFCELRLNTGNDENRARDLFLALWIPDLFMERVRDGGMWSLMCPDECPGLNNSHSEEFNRLYLGYEQEGRYKRQVDARELWMHIMRCQIETGVPYVLFKDHCNAKSNQKNLGTIRSSNLCTEIVEYSDTTETAVCNLASICLPAFITQTDTELYFDYDKLMQVVAIVVKNLNKVIDINFYATEPAKTSNSKHRPIGVGVQGLADVYNRMGYPYESAQATELNKRIFETIYYAGWKTSCELAKKGTVYSSFSGSPLSQGQFQFNMWGLKDNDLLMNYDWHGLREDIIKWGAANSLITTVMPTASTSQIMGCSEMIDPYLLNIFTRTTLAGPFIVINNQLVADLIKLGLWDDDMRMRIIINNGSIQNIYEIPSSIRDVYKTAFELKLKSIIQQSIDRAPFIDQSQSLNLCMSEPNFDILNSALFYGWENGLKTGMYYLRTKPAVSPIQFGIDIADYNRLSGTTTLIDRLDKNYRLTDNPTYASCRLRNKDDPDGTCVVCSA